jgi:hypothetical protein
MGVGIAPECGIFGVAEELTLPFRARNDQGPNDVYQGHVTLPNGQRRTKAFVKMFSPVQRNQLVYNEVVAHLLAVQCGLPSPLTFPCAVRRSMLRNVSLSLMAPDPACQFVMGVASIDGNAKSLLQRVRSSEAVWADLMNWPHIARAAVFDELMGNDDRHVENLIRCGPHDYTLIDNERIVFGEPWFKLNLTDLRCRNCDANVLADTIAEGTDEVMRRRMMDTAQRLVMDTILAVPDIAQHLEQRCGAPPGTTERLIEMLNHRRTLLPSLLQRHLHKGDLFRASTHR